ncbi:fibulin-2 isoform X2 [Xenopus tropicalis]|uniref:Fibulin 2 n=1 Tax=Xenopus tropicalis TaxID=8364 RepID=A0A803K1M6_XENTR|nr:fibulin-2 isoform X2 [Xenopus tropicalis]
MASDICRDISTSFLCIVVLLLIGSQTSLAQKDCTDVECEPPVNCIEEAIEEGSCCPTCVQFGCTCEGYQYYDCVNVGFKDGKVPEGESYFVDFGSTECSCPAGGGRISCHFIPCPELPPNCIDTLQPADGCGQCGRIGCIHGEEKYDAGHTFHMSLCKFCHCPNTGGELMCYEIPDCDLELDSTTPLMDTPDSDPERQYDYPYSQEHEATELANPAEKNNNYKRNALQDHSLLDYDDGLGDSLNSSNTKVYPFNEVDFTTSSYKIHPTSVQKGLNATSMANAYRTKPTNTIAITTTPTYNDSRLEETTAQQITLHPHIEPEVMGLKDPFKFSNVLPTSSKGDLKTDFQTTTAPHTMSPMSRHESPEDKREEPVTQLNSIPTVAPTPQQQENSQQMTTESSTTLPHYIEERYDPSHIYNISRLHDGSTKDLVETCCAAGQQWSIDHGECENMPLSASEECRLAEKQCCISYIKENTCIAGMIAAKEDGICLPAENDICERSYFKLCCDCCSWGLKVRKEGSSCESNLNLGYPCNHMMILCCNGEEQLIPPDAKIPSKPELLVLPEADIDECVLNTHTCIQGERCVNTVGSFICIQEERCESGFTVVNGACTDIDECVINRHTCATGERCVNTVGSYICIQERRCEIGYTLVDGVCTDINECASLAAPCKQGFTCVNTLGSFVCQRKQLKCNKGYESDENGTICIDIDECKLGTHNCSQEQSCFNLPGSHRCDCKIGYRYDLFRKACLDVNECWIYPGRLCHHTCENTVGSYKCSCFAGFQLGQDGKQCEDVNECKSNPCNQECTNVYGSYQCYCKEGYKLADDGISCEDIDECEVGTHNCSSSEECYNIQGSYKCLSYTCPENYRKVSNMVCERISCFNYQECQNSPVRISYLRLTFPAGVVVPAQIFRIGPSPTYAGDSIVLDIKKGNEENYFSSRKFNPYTGIIYLQRPVKKAKDFLLDVEMKLFRQGVVTTFLSRIYVFITSPS